MAFATNTLVNGEWTTMTIDVNAVLRHYEQQDRAASRNTVEVQRAPVLGLLTQTAIRSPLVHWILPVRLRAQHANDVAFIGDDFVQIKELRLDGFLWDVVQKNNFGARIRNARIVGSTKEYLRSHDGDILSTQIKDETEDAEIKLRAENGAGTDPQRNDPLSPQVILLQLDSGDSLFLMLRQDGNRGWEFVSNRHRVSKAMLMVQPGMHLAVDPSSRYVAVGCSEGIFAIYALNSREELERQHSRRQPLRYIESERYIYFHGVIHKMEFLYPSVDDDKHIILLVLLVSKGRTRMQLYEWETGSDLRQIRAHNRRGHLLEKSRQMPLLLIPLTIKSRFLLVFEDSMAVCRDILQGSPQFTDSGVVSEPATMIHHSSAAPLWTAWTRPFRLPYHTVKQDDIYLVREDGFVKYLEVQIEEDDIAGMDIGILDSNCGTALACLDYHPLDDNTGDMLVTGGDSCAGGTYVVMARQSPVLRESIQNWSPAQDIVTTSKFQDREIEEPETDYHGREHFPKPDRIFACVGKGTKGSITEFRYGLEARLGLETEFHTPVMDVWVSSASLCLGKDDGGSFFLLSFLNRSALLHLSNDASEIDDLDQTSTFLDLTHRTIAASLHGYCMIQVTEQSIFYTDGHDNHTFEGDEILGIYLDNDFIGAGYIIDDAVTHESIAVFTTHYKYETYVQILDLRTLNDAENGESPPQLEAKRRIRTLRSCSTHVTSLAICSIQETLYAIVAEWVGDSVALIFEPIDGGGSHKLEIPAIYGEERIRLEAFISMSVCSGPPGTLVFVCGTRNGLVVTLHISEQDLHVVDFWSARIGATSVMIKKDDTVTDRELLFMTCDSKLYTLNVPAAQTARSNLEVSSGRRVINQVWLTDARNPCLQQPGVTAIATLLPSTTDDTNADILLVSGSQLLLANMSTQPKPVPRNIPIRGTPTRLLYSRSLNALIVAASVAGRCTILFIDPETGHDISRPVDKKGMPVEYLSGLGERHERVFRLLEWSYMKDGKTWYFIVVCTNTGRLLILSTEKEATKPLETRMETDSVSENEAKVNGAQPLPPKIRHWTRYKFKCASPVYSVAGFAEGLYYCSGNTLFCDILKLSEKKFETVAQYELPSPALDLIHENGKIYATTSAHSLEVLELIKEPNGKSKIIHTHGDHVTRNALHHRILGRSKGSLLSFISDKSCSVVGLWPTHNTRADTLDPVFEARLSHSILRFRSGRCRPIWDPTWDQPSGTTVNPEIVPNFTGYPEVLGLSIDGSLYHFTILGFATWKFLRFLVNLAMQSPKICEFTYTQGTLALEPEYEPKSMMHVDGDILQRIEADDLQQLLRIGEESEEAAKLQSLFRELLRGLHKEMLDENTELSVYIRQAYKDLDFFLRPVL